MKKREILIKVIRKKIELVIIGIGEGEKLDMEKKMIGEGRRNEKDWMESRIEKIEKEELRKKDEEIEVGEIDKIEMRIKIGKFKVEKGWEMNLIVEVEDIEEDENVFNIENMVDSDEVIVEGGSKEDIGGGGGIIKGKEIEEVNRGMKREDRIELSEIEEREGKGERMGREFEEIKIEEEEGKIEGNNEVGEEKNEIKKRLIEEIIVVEIRIGKNVIEVDGGEGKEKIIMKMIEEVEEGGSLLSKEIDWGEMISEEERSWGNEIIDMREKKLLLIDMRIGKEVIERIGEREDENINGGVEEIIEDNVGRIEIRKMEDMVGIGKVLLKSIEIEGEKRGEGWRNRRRRVIMSGENVEGRKEKLGKKKIKSINEKGSLNGNVKREGNEREIKRMRIEELIEGRNKERNLGLWDVELNEEKIGKDNIIEKKILDWGNRVIK